MMQNILIIELAILLVLQYILVVIEYGKNKQLKSLIKTQDKLIKAYRVKVGMMEVIASGQEKM